MREAKIGSRVLTLIALSTALVGCGGGDSSGGGGGSAQAIGTLWVANEDLSLVRKVDSATGNWSEIDMPARVRHIAYGAGAVWAVSESEPTIYRIDPDNDTIEATIPADGPLRGIVASDTAVWVLDDAGNGTGDRPRVLHVDPSSNSIIASVDVGDSVDQFANASLGPAAVYVGMNSGFGAYRIDPGTDQVTASVLPGEGGGYGWGEIAFGDDRLWLTDQYSNNLFELDPTSLTQLSKSAIDADWDGDMVATSDYVFISYGDAGQVIALSTADGSTSMKIDVGGKARTMTRAKGKLIVGLIDTDGGDVILVGEKSGKVERTLPGVYADEIAVQ